MHEDVVRSGARSDRLIEDDVLLGNEILSLCPGEAPVHTWLIDAQVLTILCDTSNNTLWTIISKQYLSICNFLAEGCGLT
jgi:hypothetical protein